MEYPSGTIRVRRRVDFDLWLGHAVQGRSNRHQLWAGKPGKGKTARLHRHIKNSVGHDLFPDVAGRVSAPIYSGRITPAKWYVRGWQHHLEPLLCLNDVTIRRVDNDWESMLCQFLEVAGRRTIRWDIKARTGLEAEDRRDIARYLQRNGLLDQFLREQRERSENDRQGGAFGPDGRHGRPSFRQSLPELDDFERSYGADEDDVDRPDPVIGPADEPLKVPRSYDTESTVIMVVNSLGDEGWDRIFSRLRVFLWDPLPEEQMEDLRAWDPPVPGAIMAVIDSCHRAGEVLNLDYRAVLDAAEALKLGMPWEDALRASFFAQDDQQVQEDASDVLDWLSRKSARPGQAFTERDLYQEIGSLRGERNKARRSAVLDYLLAQGWIERSSAPALLQPGRRGRRPAMMFRVLRLAHE